MQIYAAVHDNDPLDESAVRREVLWYNKKIGGSKAPVHWPSWEKAGIKTVGDLCHHSEGRLLSHHEIQASYGIKCSFLDALSIRLNIPSHWHNLISANWQPLPQHGPDIYMSLNQEGPQIVSALPAKRMYKCLVSQEQITSASFRKWSKGIDNIKVDNEHEWQEMCSRTFSSSRETKLQSLQYKLLNRIVPCGVHLKQIRIRDTDECNYCQSRDTIVHFFCQCQQVCAFWNKVCTWFRQTVDLYLDRLSQKEFLFGLSKDCHRSKVINSILMQICFYIFRQKLFHQSELSLVHWLREFKGKLETERWICARLGKPTRFDCWKEIHKELG